MPAGDFNAPPRIPDFELLRCIGRGSYGEVWLARSVTGALRAVKIVHRSRFDSARPYEREFQGIQKYEPVSRSTEGLVHLLHVSRAEDFFYYVMELADGVSKPANHEPATGESVARDPAARGTSAADTRAPSDSRNTGSLNTDALITGYAPRTLQSELRQHGRLPYADCLRIGLALTRGLEQLHAGGLIHRDLKPSNIIFVNGAPKLADIGLVTDADAARTLVGTEGYLPPDGGGTASADLYSLGKVLYEICTGMDRQQFPVMPPDFATWPDRAQVLELSEVFEKACEAQPARRYPNAAAMRTELELLGAGVSVVRRRRQGWLARQLGRAAMFLILGAGLVAAGWWWRQQTPPSARSLSDIAQANSEYQLGRVALEKRSPDSLSNALFRFDTALRLDSAFPLALAGRAEALALLANYQHEGAAQRWREARASATAALQRVPNLASAHFTLGLVAKNHDFDWAESERRFRAGLALDGNAVHGHQWLSSLLGALGRADEAVAAARRAVELEPSSRSANANLAIQLHLARRYEEAVTQYRRVLALAPDFASAREHLSRLYLATDRLHEGLKEQMAMLRDLGESRSNLWALNNARLEHGTRGYWLERLRHLDARPAAPAFPRAEALAQLGDVPGACATFAVAISNREPEVIYLGVDPLYDPLRTNDAFLALCQRLQLPGRPMAAASPAGPLTREELAAGLTSEEKAAGFRPLFDGLTLQGWRADEDNWSVQEGALAMARTGQVHRSHLRYVAQTVPDNFELRFEWRVQPGGESGVNYRPGLVEYQVIDNALVPERARVFEGAGALFACIGHRNADSCRPVGEWNQGRIVCEGTTIEHWLNGRKQFRYDYTHRGLTHLLAALDREEMKRIKTTFGNVRARGGYLSLQDEGFPGAAFRRLRWRALE